MCTTNDSYMEMDKPSCGYYLSACSSLDHGDPISAIALLTQAITKNDADVPSRLMRAQLLLRMGDLSTAASDAEWLYSHEGDMEEVLLLTARVAYAQGENEKALYIYNKVLEVNPNLAEAYTERGRIYFERGESQLAEADLRKVLELNPQKIAEVSGEYSAEGSEHHAKRGYSVMNPFGL